MTEQNKEMLDTFEVMYNNITSNQAPGLDVYEISLFLTQAQEELVKNRFVPTGNKRGEGIDDSVKRQLDFSTLIRTKKVTENTAVNDLNKVWYHGKSHYFLYPTDLFLVLNEQCIVKSTEGTAEVPFTVVPIDHLEYDRLMQKPYKYPFKGQVWKVVTDLNTSGESSQLLVELAGVRNIFEDQTLYCMVRYVKRPEPIILENLGDELSIHGEHTEKECKLPKHLFDEIIQRAVELAKASWQGDLSTTIQMGDRKE